MKYMRLFTLVFLGFSLVTWTACQKDFDAPTIESSFERADCPLVSCEELSIVSAEIVARRGRHEDNPELRDYFKYVDKIDTNTFFFHCNGLVIRLFHICHTLY